METPAASQPSEPIVVSGAAGQIEGRLERPLARDEPRFLAVFGHPHPQKRGTMQNSVVVHGARALARAGGAVARFNFRGVGRSEGSYDHGRGELDDFVAVVRWMRERWPRIGMLVAAGFSFGSIRALEACAAGASDAWLGVAPPFFLSRAQPLPRLASPAALVLAGSDELALRPSAEELAERFADLRAVEVVEGAGHLFIGKISELASAVGTAAERILPAG